MPTLHSTSWSMIQRAAGGDAGAGEEFAQRYSPVVRAYFCARWKLSADHERVEDATQDVFLQCFKVGGALHRNQTFRNSGFRAYLYGVARRVGASIDRRCSRQPDRGSRGSAFFESVEHPQESPSRVFDHGWARMLVQEAGELAHERAVNKPGHLRGLAALALRFEGGLKPRDIAEKLGVRNEEVHEMLRTAKQGFRAAFLDVMASYNPDATEAELRRKCVELTDDL